MMKKCLALVLTVVLMMLALPALAADKTTFKLNNDYDLVFVGSTVQMEVLRSGEAAEGTVTYTSSNDKRATVDTNGLVTGISKGQVSITARLETEKQTYKSVLTVTVAAPVTQIDVTEKNLPVFDAADPLVAPLLQLDPQDADAALPVLLLRKGSQLSLTVNAMPSEANDRRTVLSVSDEDMVRVQNKTLTGRALGNCILTIASRQNPEVTRRYRLLVIQPVTKVSITADTKSMYVGDLLPLSATFAPEDASIQSVVWTSSNEKVATVDESGIVMGMSKGQATIRATAVDGSKRYATFTVTVKQQPQSVTLKEDSAVINVGRYKTLKATVLPGNTNDKSVTWASSDENIATVNKQGRVTGIAPGVCVITCTAKDFSEVYAAATVTVCQPVTKVAFADEKVSFNVGDTCQLFWQTSPVNATNTAVSFQSSNTKIATVDESGVVTGLKRGECTITVTAQDGSKKRDTVKISVLQPVLGVHMDNDTIRVGVDESYTARAVLEPSDASNNRMTWVSEDTSIATVKGSRNKPTITGQRWGTTTITGTTEDGGYTTTATVNVGNYDKALEITDLYLSDNRIKISVENESNMTVTRFSFVIECYDLYDAPLTCNDNGTHVFYGSYGLTLYEGESTEHGRFYFGDFVQPEEQIGRVVMRITGYSTDTGYSREIKSDRQTEMEFRVAGFIGETPVPEVTPPAEP